MRPTLIRRDTTYKDFMMSMYEPRSVNGKVVVEPTTGRVVEIEFLSSHGLPDRSYSFWYQFNKRIDTKLSEIEPYTSLMAQNRVV